MSKKTNDIDPMAKKTDVLSETPESPESKDDLQPTNTDPMKEKTGIPSEIPASPESKNNSQPVQSRPERLIYVGPNAPGGILQRFQVFKGGLPPYCKDLFEQVPEIKELFVPVEELSAVREKIEESGANEARLFYLVQQKLNKGVK